MSAANAQVTEFKITAGDGEMLNVFGESVSISGHYAIVGAPGTMMFRPMAGRCTSLNETRQRIPGRYTVPVDGQTLYSGMYVYRIQAGNIIQYRNMLLVK